MLTKDEVLAPLAALRTNEIVVTTMGTVRPWGALSSHELDFASADSAMGHAADLALGLALAQPARRVICLNGDGSMLMSLGTLAVIGEQTPRNLILFVFENRTYEITGNQATPGAGRVDFAGVARACGFASVFSFVEPAAYRDQLPQVLAAEGPTFVLVRTEPGEEPPLGRGPQEAAVYLKVPLHESAQRLRAALVRG
jgi:sulfopyruvate decarboxylase subunit beta